MAQITLDTADRLAISERLSQCAWALDTGDVESFVTSFCKQGVLEWDAFGQPLEWRGHDALRHFVTVLRDLPSSAGRQHHVSNTVITPGDGHALAKSYVTVALRQGDGPHLLYVMGWYHDELQHEDGDWRLSRRVIRDWSGPVLGAFAGQDGKRVARPMPPPLEPLLYRPGKG